jgi:hypothetical protein
MEGRDSQGYHVISKTDGEFDPITAELAIRVFDSQGTQITAV